MRLEDFIRNELIADLTCLFTQYLLDSEDEDDKQYWLKSANELNEMTLESIMKLSLDYVNDYELSEHIDNLVKEFISKLNN